MEEKKGILSTQNYKAKSLRISSKKAQVTLESYSHTNFKA